VAIRDEQTSSLELVKDARYHHAAVLRDPRAKHLAPAVKTCQVGLKGRFDARLEAEGVQIEKFALFIFTDLELDAYIRKVELEVLAAVDKIREDARYEAVLPDGLTGIVSLRGADEARAVGLLNKELARHFPDIATRHAATLTALAEATTLAEEEWKQAEVDAGQAMTHETIARRELVQQLQKNEGALMILYPGQKRRVRSYFRTLARKASDDGGGGEGGGVGGT